MRVLVTEGAGFIGLVVGGHRVVLLDRLLAQAYGHSAAPWTSGHQLVRGDAWWAICCPMWMRSATRRRRSARRDMAGLVR